jgi:3',5'-cyclic AMP phosphodiesterase CpdA
MRTIAHISDLHFGRADPAVAEGLAADLTQRKVDVLVASGDFTQRGRGRQYAAAAQYLARLPRPQIVIPGNHDIPLFDVVRRFFFPLERYTRYISVELAPFYRDDELAVLGINTARSWTWKANGFWRDGRISPQQLQAVQVRLEELPPRTFKVVATHHPFIPPPGERRHGIVGGAAAALNVLEACGVDLLLAGHLHMGYSGDVRTHHEAVKRSMLSVQAGTAISTRRRAEPNAYNLIAIEPDNVSIEVRAWTGSWFDTAETTRYQRIEGTWRRADGRTEQASQNWLGKPSI